MGLNLLHHAYLLIGQSDTAEEVVVDLLEKEGINPKNSPDYFVYKEPLLSVDLAREISEKAIQKAFTGRKFFFISPERFTYESQNALLKTFEEPIGDTFFFINARNTSAVIPTLLSRVQTVNLAKEDSDLSEVQKFLKGSIKEKLAFAKKFVDQEKNLSTFLDDLLLELRKKSGNPGSLEQVYRLRLSSDDRGASARLILEHLSVVL